jgi:hypothetical protein
MPSSEYSSFSILYSTTRPSAFPLLIAFVNDAEAGEGEHVVDGGDVLSTEKKALQTWICAGMVWEWVSCQFFMLSLGSC